MSNSDTPKIPYRIAFVIAETLIEDIRPFCHRVEIAGSLRRMTPEVGDIEIVAMPYRIRDLFGEERQEGPTELDRYLDDRTDLIFTSRGAKYQRFNVPFGQWPEFSILFDKGPESSLLFDQGPYVAVDLFLPTAATWGSIYTIRTGSWEFSRWLVSQRHYVAQGAGITFSEGLLYLDGRLLSTPEEEHVFAALGIAYIPPRERTGVPVNPVRVDPVWVYAD